MATPALRRLPLAPLEAVMRERHVTSSSVLADICGVQPVTWRTWRSTGVTVWQADRLAVAIGLHPLSIWPDWLDPAYDSPKSAQLVFEAA